MSGIIKVQSKEREITIMKKEIKLISNRKEKILITNATNIKTAISKFLKTKNGAMEFSDITETNGFTFGVQAWELTEDGDEYLFDIGYNGDSDRLKFVKCN